MNKAFWKNIEKSVSFLLVKIFKLSLSQDKLDTIVQFIKFGIVGLSNTIISYVIYIVSLFGMQSVGFFPVIDYLIAQIVGFVLSVLWSFYWNHKYVFQDKKESRNWLHALIKTYISYAFTGLFLNSILSLIWVEVFRWSKLIAPVINLLISVPLNFILNKFWAFRSNSYRKKGE